MKDNLRIPGKFILNSHDAIKKKSPFTQEKREIITNTSTYDSFKNESVSKLRDNRMESNDINNSRRNNLIFDFIKPASFIIIPSKSLNSSNILSKNETSSCASLSSSISSHSMTSLSPSSNFTDTELKQTNSRPQTSTPILFRNQLDRHQSKSSKSARSDSNYGKLFLFF